MRSIVSRPKKCAGAAAVIAAGAAGTGAGAAEVGVGAAAGTGAGIAAAAATGVAVAVTGAAVTTGKRFHSVFERSMPSDLIRGWIPVRIAIKLAQIA